jgi:hypothetical protein
MTHQEFETVFLDRFIRSHEVLCSKAREYAQGEDRLVNFKTAAAFQGCTPERALWGMASKHLVALSDFMAMLDACEDPPAAWWEEKLGDAINYLILLDGLLRERHVRNERSNA